MPRVDLDVTQINRSGVAPPTPETGDATNNHQMVNNGKTILLVANTSGSTARAVTFHLSPKVDGQTVTPRTTSIPASSSRYFGPFPVAEYGRTLQVDVAHAELTLTALSI